MRHEFRLGGDEVGWLPWQRPGFDLGLELRDACKKSPKLQGIVLQNHGLIHWAATSKGCYELALALINRAIEYFERKSARSEESWYRAAARSNTRYSTSCVPAAEST